MRPRCSLATLAFILATGTHGAGQTSSTGAIHGQVTDAQGRSIPNAKLVLRTLKGSYTRTCGTLDFDQGRFRFIALPGGTLYWLTTSAPGKVDQVDLVVVNNNAYLQHDVKLLSPAEFSQAHPSLPLSGLGEEEGFLAVDTFNHGLATFGTKQYTKALRAFETARQGFEKARAKAATAEAQTRFETQGCAAERMEACTLVELGHGNPATRADFFARAEPLLQKAFDRGPADAAVYLALAEVLQERGEAALLARVRSGFRGSNPVVSFNLGVAASNDGRFEEAKTHFEKAAKLDPGFSEAHYMLALCEQELGHRETARIHLRDYLSLAPEGVNAGNAKRLLAQKP